MVYVSAFVNVVDALRVMIRQYESVTVATQVVLMLKG